MASSNRMKRLIGLFLLGYLLFNHPLISLFNLPQMVLGIPLLYGYIFGVWILLIVLMALIVSSEDHGDQKSIRSGGRPRSSN
jgi:L-lactate permease